MQLNWHRGDDSLPKVIALFNHKGGVSKTTTTFNLGWMLAKKKLRVLIVDADPQCNLTGLALNIKSYDTLADFYSQRSNRTVYDSLAGLFGFSDNHIDLTKGIEPSDTNHERLKLLAGHINFSKFDLQMATALTSSDAIPLLKPLIGSFNTLIRSTANKGDFDVVLVDMSPSITAMTMCILMSCDYFLIPTSPDFYCYQAIDSLSNSLPEWSRRLSKLKQESELPRRNPKLLGIISQNYRVYNRDNTETRPGKRDMTRAFKPWSDDINRLTNTRLVPELNKHNMVIAKELFETHVKHDSPYVIGTIPKINEDN